MVMGERKNIEDASADGKLARLIDKILAVETILIQHIGNKIKRNLLPYFQPQRVFGEHLFS